jgi:ACS family hexuronate transporter-like MFS transporter
MMAMPARLSLAWRWRIALLLCLITTINYLDRQALAITAPVIVVEFRLSNTEFGAINSAFLFAYALGHLLVGPFIDRIGTRRAFSLAVIAWSIAGMLHAAGRGFVSLLSLRALLGISEAANFPAALKSVAEWFPKQDRALAVGIVTMGPGLGAVIAPPLLGWLVTEFGWPWAFLVPGLAGFVWLSAWLAWYQLPDVHPSVMPAERALIAQERDQHETAGSPTARDLMLFFRYRETWGLILSRFANDGAFYFFVSWLPLYLAQARGFDIREIAAFAWIPFLAADVGSLAGGWAGGKLIARGWSLDASRKTVIWVGALLVPLTLPAATSDSPAMALALIALAMFAIQLKASNLFALPVDLFAAREAASIWGLFGAVGSFGGMAFVAAVGWVTDRYSYEPVFWAVGLTQVLSAVCVSVLIPRIEPLRRAGA